MRSSDLARLTVGDEGMVRERLSFKCLDCGRAFATY